MANLKVTFNTIFNLTVVMTADAYRGGSFDEEDYTAIVRHVETVYPWFHMMVNSNIEHVAKSLMSMYESGDIGWAKAHTIIVPAYYDEELNYDEVVVELDV